MRTSTREYEDAAKRINRKLDFAKINSAEDYQREFRKLTGQSPTQLQLKTFFETNTTKRFLNLGRIFQRAGGRNLAQDQMKTAKTVVRSPQEFIRLGAQRSDLEGLDTARTFGYIKNMRAKIDKSRSRVVFLKPTYKRTFRRTGKTITVKRKKLIELRVYNSKGRRLALARKKRK